MLTLVIASTNPVKIQAAVSGFQRLFPGKELNVITAAVPSDVRYQPLSDEETLRGALTGAFFLPPVVADLIRHGKELGEADDIAFHGSNSRQDNGAVGLLTDNVIDRVQSYEHALILALIPFKNEALYAARSQAARHDSDAA